MNYAFIRQSDGQKIHRKRIVVSVHSVTLHQGCAWSRSRRLRLETVSRRTDVSSRSRLEKNCQRFGLVSVSAIYVSCPRPIFGQIAQATVGYAV